MSLLDFLLVVVALASVVYVNTPLACTKNTRIVLGFFVVLLAVQILFEGFRGYLLFLYLTYALLTALFSAMGFSGFFGRYRLTKGFMMVIVALCVLPAFMQALLFPVAALPFDRDTYAVGTKSFLMTDKSMNNGWAADKKTSSSRVLALRFFYPSDRPGIKRAPWLENGKIIGKQASKLYHFPGFYAANLDLVQSNAYYDGALTTKTSKLPVVIISHKVGTHADFYVSLAEALATRGYVVVLVNHTDASLAAVAEDGKVLPFNRALLADENSQGVYNLYEQDLEGVIKFIGKLNEGKYVSTFKNQLRMENMMFVGHGASGRALSQPSKSIINIGCQVLLDPFIDVETIKPYEVYKTPTLILSSEDGYRKEQKSELAQYVKAAESDIYYYYVKGSKANDLNGLCQSNPVLRVMGLKGNLMVQKEIEAWQSLVVDYANLHLKNQQRHGSLLTGGTSDSIKAIYIKNDLMN